MTVIYKIRRADGLFSMGGTYPSFNKTGKIWKRPGHLTNHFNQLGNGVGTFRTSNHNTVHIYGDCEIVSYKVVETETGLMSLQHWMMAVEDRKRKKDEVEKLRYEDARKKERKKAYEELQKEFG